MKFELNNKDFWAGVMFIAIGGAAMFIARDYQFGSALQMEPGFFPTILGGILIAFGVCIMVTGLRAGKKIQGAVSLRPAIMMPLALILFGKLLELAGFIPALIVLIFCSAASGKEFKTVEVMLLAGILTMASTAVFIWGLGLPYPLVKGW
jgi:hypothetical protein